MVFQTVGFWRHRLMAILMQSVFRGLTLIRSCATPTCVPLLSPGYRRHLHWQEMPLHWKCLHSWSYPLWSVHYSVWMLQYFSINLFPSQYHPCFSYTNATLSKSSLTIASHAFSWTLHGYVPLWMPWQTWCLDCCYFLSLPCKWCFITMVFQTLWVVRIVPNGSADVVKWQPLMLVCVFKSWMSVYVDWCWCAGVVTKMKMQRTIVIRRDYLHYIRKYNRFEKRHKNMSVHLSPCFRYDRLWYSKDTSIVELVVCSMR